MEGQDPATDSVPGFDTYGLRARAVQFALRSETGYTRSDDDDVQISVHVPPVSQCREKLGTT
jgi:hypothetical protein